MFGSATALLAFHKRHGVAGRERVDVSVKQTTVCTQHDFLSHSHTHTRTHTHTRARALTFHQRHGVLGRERADVAVEPYRPCTQHDFLQHARAHTHTQSHTHTRTHAHTRPPSTTALLWLLLFLPSTSGTGSSAVNAWMWR